MYSKRGQDAVQLLPKYLADARSVTKYSATTSPNGALQLGVAELLMLEDWLVPALNEDHLKQKQGSDEEEAISMKGDSIYYQATPGREDFRRAMIQYMEDLLRIEGGRVNEGNLVVGAGCNAVLENLCIVLADPGDTILIPTPYYAAFEFDLSARADLHVQPVQTQLFHHDKEKASSTTAQSTFLDPTI